MRILATLVTGIVVSAGTTREATNAPALPVAISLREPAGVARRAWPVTSGVPLPQGAVKEPGELALLDAAGTPVPCQIDPVCRWPDGSIKWVHLTFFADLAAGGELTYALAKGRPAAISKPLAVTEDADRLLIDTAPGRPGGGPAASAGAARIAVSKRTGSILEYLQVGGKKVVEGAGLTLTGAVRLVGPLRLGLSLPSGGYVSPGPSFDRGEIRINSCAKTETWKLHVIDNRTFRLVGSVTGEDGILTRDAVKDGKTWTSSSGSISVRAGWWSSLSHHTPDKIGAEKAYYQWGSDASQVGKVFSTLKGKVEQVTVERSGPLVACVYLEGTFAGEDGQPVVPVPSDEKGQPYYDDASGDFLKYRLRLYAYAGKPGVYLVPAISHVGPFDGSLRATFNSLSMHFAVPGLGRETRVTLSGVEGAAGTQASLLQLLGVTPFTEAEPRRKLSYAVTLDGAERATGERATGSALIGAGAEALGFGVRRFWEYGPKGITLNPGQVTLHLWPAVKEIDGYTLGQGRQRSHEVLIAASHEAKEDLAAFQAPRLVATAPPAWYADCGVFGPLAEARDYAKGYPEAQVEALRRYEQLMASMVDDRQRIGGLPGTVLAAFVPGWSDYGDLAWADGYCNLHYDWTMSMLLHFLRTGKREFFDAADAMAWHRKDIAQNHSDLSGGRKTPRRNWSNHITFYEKDNHRGPAPGAPSHTWNRGIAYWYLLTGDPEARLAAVQNAEALGRWYADWLDGKGPGLTPDAELRHSAWTIENFLGAYELTGERKYLDWATGLFRSSFLPMCQKQAIASATKMQPLMYGYSFAPLCRLHHYTNDPQVLEAVRYLFEEALMKRFLSGGKTLENGRYLMFLTPYSWKKSDWEAGKYEGRGEVAWNFFWADPAAYLYLHTGEARYLDLARRFFKDSVFYYAADPQPQKADYRSPAAYVDRMFPGSYSKVHGWAGRYNHIYLYVEKLVSQGAAFPAKTPWRAPDSERLAEQRLGVRKPGTAPRAQ